MRLTRRDAVVSLTFGIGTGALGLFTLEDRDQERPGGSVQLSESQIRTLVATAEVIYPSEVSGREAFVEEYVTGLPSVQKQAIGSAVDGLERYTRRERGTAFTSLGVDGRDSVLRSMGVDRVGSSNDGRLPERIRYYVVNQLLFGLYTSPTGSELVGIENPVGYPGGYESYQQPPRGEETTATDHRQYQSDL